MRLYLILELQTEQSLVLQLEVLTIQHSQSHSSGDLIEKYEFSGVSLRRINKTHDMNSPAVTVPNDKDLDFYHIKVDMSSDGTNRSGGTLPDRFFSSTNEVVELV